MRPRRDCVVRLRMVAASTGRVQDRTAHVRFRARRGSGSGVAWHCLVGGYETQFGIGGASPLGRWGDQRGPFDFTKSGRCGFCACGGSHERDARFLDACWRERPRTVASARRESRLLQNQFHHERAMGVPARNERLQRPARFLQRCARAQVCWRVFCAPRSSSHVLCAAVRGLRCRAGDELDIRRSGERILVDALAVQLACAHLARFSPESRSVHARLVPG